MFIESCQQKARQSSTAMVERFREKARGGGGGITASNVAVGDYAALSGFVFGRNQEHERQYAHYRGWTFAAIRPIATTIAAQPVRVARKASQGRPGPKRSFRAVELGDKAPHWLTKSMGRDLDVYEDHPILHVIDRPNDQMTKWHLVYITVAGLQLCGKQHWWLTVDKETDRPVIWPIPATWIQPVHTKEKAFDHWRMLPGGSGDPVDLKADEIIYFYYPDPGNPLGVTAPLGACSRMVAADDSIVDAQYRMFRQGIWPGYAVIAGDYTDDDGEEAGRPLLEAAQRQQIMQAIRRHWGGVMNMNEPLILDALIKDVKKITNTPQEMDFRQSGQITKDSILQTFGTNEAVIGGNEGLNRAAAIAARYSLADFTVNPLIQMLSETMTYTLGTALASDEDEQVFIWIEPYRPDDADAKRSNYQTAVASGCKIRQDEYRVGVCNLPPLGAENGGDEFCQPQPKPGAGGPGGPPGGANPADAGQPGQPSVKPTTDTEAAQQNDAGASMATAVQNVRIKSFVKGNLTIRQQEHYRTWRKGLYLKAHGQTEDRLTAIVKDWFAQQRKAVMEALVKAAKHGLGDAATLTARIFDAAEWTKRLKQAVKGELLRAMLKGAATEYSAVKCRQVWAKAKPSMESLMVEMPSDVKAAVVQALNKLVDADFWDDVSETTKAQLAESLAEGIENGESLYQLACRVGDDPQTEVGLENPGVFEPGETFGTNPVLGDGPSTARARLIARTETTGCMNCGHNAALDHLEDEGLIVGKTWSCIEDEHTRPSHTEATAEYGEGSPIRSGEKFVIHDEQAGDVEVEYPGDITAPPSVRCNCRCLVESAMADEFVAAGGEPDDLPDDQKRTLALAHAVSSAVVQALLPAPA